MTLPEDIIARLQAIDPDLGRAIVTLAGTDTPRGRRPIRAAELSTYGNQAVIVVMPFKSLKRLPNVKLVPIGNGRALISLDRRSVSDFELDVRDALDRLREADPERPSIEMLARILRDARRSEDVTVKERTIIVLESKRRRGR